MPSLVERMQDGDVDAWTSPGAVFELLMQPDVETWRLGAMQVAVDHPERLSQQAALLLQQWWSSCAMGGDLLYFLGRLATKQGLGGVLHRTAVRVAVACVRADNCLPGDIEKFLGRVERWTLGKKVGFSKDRDGTHDAANNLLDAVRVHREDTLSEALDRLMREMSWMLVSQRQVPDVPEESSSQSYRRGQAELANIVRSCLPSCPLLPSESSSN